MKAVLLAAGRGERLRPLTNTVPKCLVPICGRPLLLRWLDMLADQGVAEVLINTHYLADRVQSAVDSWRGNAKVVLAFEPELLGSAGTLRANRAFVESEREFFIVYADNLADVSLAELHAAHVRAEAVFTTFVYETTTPSVKGICVVDSTDRIVEFVEKPQSPRSNLANSGIAMAGSALLDAIPAGRVVDLGRDVMPALAGRMQVVRTSAYIRDIGSLADYEIAETEWEKLHGRHADLSAGAPSVTAE